MEHNNKIKYASFWTRLLAFIVDIAVIFLIASSIKLTRLPFVGFIALWLYFALSISRWGTTVGGKLLGIEFYSEEGNRLSFLKASLRWFVSMLPFIIYRFIREMQYTMSPPPSPEVQMLPQFIFILAPFVMFFTQKRQMLHDMAVKSIVADVNKASIKAKEHQTVKREESFPPKPIYYVRMAIRIIGMVLFLIVGGYMVFYTFVFYKLGKAKTEAYDQSFHTTYHTKDFNDSRILFYQKELERYSNDFIEAEGMYDIFAADVKRDLALNCIEAALREHNVTDWIELGDAFRKNARNKFANNETKIRKAKANEDWMGRHFYDYDLNDVNHIEDQIASIWEKDKNKETCDALMPVEKMFEQRFMPRYIANREEAIGRYRWELADAKFGSYPKPSFYRKQVFTQSSWLKTLKLHNPEAVRILSAHKAEEARQKREAEAKRKKREKEKKQKALWQCVEENRCPASSFFRGMNANIKNEQGQTPLMVAAQNGYYYAIESLAEANVDVWTQDSEGKTAFDYIKKPTSREEWIYSSRVYGALRVLEVRQIVKDKAEIVHYSYKYNTDMLSITIKGAQCEDFVFPKHTKCTYMKPRKTTGTKEEIYEDDIKRGVPPIFAAIQNRLYDKVQQLLEEGADIEQKNKFGATPLLFAIYHHDDKLVKLLLKYGANPNIIDGSGYTPLSEACDANQVSTVKILLQNGADVNYQYNKSETALTVAAKGCKNFELVKLLLDHGANPYLMDTYGYNTLTGLKRYCRNTEAYEKMKQFIQMHAKH